VEATWELVGLAMGQAAVKWNTTDDKQQNGHIETFLVFP
jgi:hypothetical protein